MGTYDRSDPLRSQNPQREERGGSDFLIIVFSYNAGYAKHRGVKKPSFPNFGPFRRFLSLLGWLGRFFAFCTVVLFECIALYVWSAFLFYNRPVARKTFSNSNVQFFAARFGCGILTTSVSLPVQTKLLL